MGITMLDSLYQHGAEANIWVLDLDDQIGKMVAHRIGAKVELVQLSELLDLQPALVAAREQRSLWEFYSTLRPVLLSLVLARLPANDALCYVDSDIYFFSSPKCIFKEAQDAVAAISPHRFSAQTRHLRIHGIYNAGLLLLRNCAAGAQILQSWEQQCLAWCGATPQQGGRFMNQGYLTQWPQQFEGLLVMQHPGANLAPWNVGTHRIVQRDDSETFVDGLPLVCFHFSSLWRDAPGFWQTYDLCSAMHQDSVLNGMYAPYIQALENNAKALKHQLGVEGTAQPRNRSNDAHVITLNV